MRSTAGKTHVRLKIQNACFCSVNCVQGEGTLSESESKQLRVSSQTLADGDENRNGP